MEIVIASLLFMIGASVGSFVNVLIMRTVEGKQWVKGRSLCDHCKRELSWMENIPLLSFALLMGRSRCCKKLLSPQYPIVEGMMGLLFVWWYTLGQVFFRLGQSPLRAIQPVYWLIIGMVMIGIFFADSFFGIIPDILVVTGYITTLIYLALLGFGGAMTWRDIGLSVVMMGSGYLVFLALHLITRGKGMGYGDVKLAGLIGLILGYPQGVVGLYAGFVVGAIFSLGLIILGKRRFGQTIPFGPFMVVGMVIAMVWGERLVKLSGFYL